MKGKIIAIEGIDGSGKNTQAEFLYKYFKEEGRKVVKMHFPLYEKTFFGKEVANYLNGDFGSLNEVNPKLAALLYAGDRFEAKEKIIDLIEKGYVLIFDRYVHSNIAHQASKIKDKKEREDLKRWIEELEYSVFEIPKPDNIIFLDMPPVQSKKLVLNKDKRKYTDKKEDLHESDKNHLMNAYDYYKKLSLEEKWIEISCFNKEKNKIKSASEISKKIISSIEKTIG